MEDLGVELYWGLSLEGTLLPTILQISLEVLREVLLEATLEVLLGEMLEVSLEALLAD